MRIMYFIIFFLLQLSCNCYAQRIEDYRFVVKDKIIIDSTSGFYLHSELEFTYQREILRDSTFNEIGLFASSGNNRNAYTFKVKNGNWYIKNKNNWDIFYSVNKPISPRVRIGSIPYQFKIVETSLVNGVNCVIYKLIPIGVQVGGETYYWFNPDKGIIMLKADDVKLIREDIVK